MRLRPAMLACLLVPSAVHAAPTARFTWQLETLAGCYRQVSDQYVQDGANVGVGVTGLSEPFTAFAIDLEIAAQDGQPLPGAWRFDAEGCSGPAGVSWKTHPSPGSPCGWLYDMGTSPLPQTSITFDGVRLHLSLLLEVGASADPLPGGESLAAIARLSGGCDGADDPTCFLLRSLRFRRPDGSWFEADRPTSVITLNAASLDGPAACAAVPARAATWGEVKGAYR